MKFLTDVEFADEVNRAFGDLGTNTAIIMLAVGFAESNGQVDAVGDNVASGHQPEGSPYRWDLGLMQINSIHGYDLDRLISDPHYNLVCARAIFNREGYGAWSTFRFGNWRKHLARAQFAFESLDHKIEEPSPAQLSPKFTWFYDGENIVTNSWTRKVLWKYGPRPPLQTPLGVTEPFHDGIDIDLRFEEIPSPRDALVLFATDNDPRGFGAWVMLGFPEGGLFTGMSFSHLSRVFVKRGDIIRADQLIGVSGDSGISSAPHLHVGRFRMALSGVDTYDSKLTIDPLAKGWGLVPGIDSTPMPAVDDREKGILRFEQESLAALANNPPVDLSAALRELGERVKFLRQMLGLDAA